MFWRLSPKKTKPYFCIQYESYTYGRGHLSSIEVADYFHFHISVQALVLVLMTLVRRTRGPGFHQRLMWPQPLVIAVACNFSHIRCPQYRDVFHQLRLVFYVVHYGIFTSFQEIHLVTWWLSSMQYKAQGSHVSQLVDAYFVCQMTSIHFSVPWV